MSTDARLIAMLRSISARHGVTFQEGRLPTQSAIITPSGQRVSYLDWPGDGPPLLLLHGGALTAHTWDFVCMELADFHCVAMDLRGHGDSADAEDYRIEAAVADAVSLADSLGWPRLHIAGMSLGGNVAFHFAARYPSRVLSLSMVDVGPGVVFDASGEMRAFVQQASRVQSIDALVDSVMALRPRGDRELIEYRYAHLMRRMPDGSWQWKRDLRKPTDFEHIFRKLDEIPSLAHRIDCPALVARGARSRIFPEDRAIAFAAMFPDGRCAVIPDAGHNIQEDNPKALADEVRLNLR
jgi:pimeloyl-ACP methyl ester carboxylesterase